MSITRKILDGKKKILIDTGKSPRGVILGKKQVKELKEYCNIPLKEKVNNGRVFDLIIIESEKEDILEVLKSNCSRCSSPNIEFIEDLKCYSCGSCLWDFE